MILGYLQLGTPVAKGRPVQGWRVNSQDNFNLTTIENAHEDNHEAVVQCGDGGSVLEQLRVGTWVLLCYDLWMLNSRVSAQIAAPANRL